MKQKASYHDFIYIVDVTSFLLRAYYSAPKHTKDGVSIHAVVSFFQLISFLIKEHKPQGIILVWDTQNETQRHMLFQGYKKKRTELPEDFHIQRQFVEEFADTIGLAQIYIPTIEADDIMFSLAKHFEHKAIKTMVVTTDKDLSQALTAFTYLYDPFKKQVISKELLEPRLKFTIDKISFFYALVGDQCDSIPGVKGIGPKKAQALVENFESLDDLYVRLYEVEPQYIRQLLIESKEKAYLSERLFKLQHFPLTLSKEACEIKNNWLMKAQEFYKKHKFISMLEKEEPQFQRQTLYQFKTITTKSELDSLVATIKERKFFAVDTEGTSLNPLKGKMLGVAICIEVGTSYYIPFGHTVAQDQLQKKQVLGTLKPILEDSSIKKVLHHAKFDALMFLNEGITLQGIYFDTLIAADLLASYGQKIGLKYLSNDYLQEPMLFFEDVVQRQGYKYFSQVPLELATEYAAADAHQTMQLYHKFYPLISEHNLDTLFYTIEMPIVKILFAMEREGIFLDTTILKTIKEKVHSELERTKLQLVSLLDDSCKDSNFNSPKQIETILFKVLKLPPVKKTSRSKQNSTDSEVLRKLSEYHEFPGILLRYRELFKLKASYLDVLAKYISPKTGRIHTSFSQVKVPTGRLASSLPNLQNIPVKYYDIRAAFVPRLGYTFLSFDYSHIELRVLAYLSQDQNLIKAFVDNEDIHAITASHIFNCLPTNVAPEQRQLGKKINFGIIYGLTNYGLSQDLDLTLEQAQQYIDAFMEKYPRLRPWMEEIYLQVQAKGYVETFFGRKRYLPSITSTSKFLVDEAKRMAINTKIQGTAAELMKLGIVKLKEELEKQKLDAKILLSIHDELLLEVHQDDLEKVQRIASTLLENVISWNVPLKVTSRSGANWQEVTKL